MKMLTVIYFMTISFSMSLSWAASAGEIVWDKNQWIRDPTLFVLNNKKVIMSGTRAFIVAYPNINSLDTSKGKSYKIHLYSPNGKVHLRDKGFWAWGKKFFNGPKHGYRMLASYNRVNNFNTAKFSTKNRRSTYLFEPMKSGPKVPGTTFSLHWKLVSNTPFSKDIYNTIPFFDKPIRSFLYSDVRADTKLDTTCILGSWFNKFTLKRDPAYDPTLCPGKRVSTKYDSTGWERLKPYPSEIRHDDGGGLLEGAWAYRDNSNNRYYLLYSAGDYAKKYGGYVAKCRYAKRGCEKVLNAKKNDVKAFLKTESRNYEAVGRPYPVIDSSKKLIDIIFHASKRGSNTNVILRCKNFYPNILKDFVNNKNHPGCLYDNL